MNKIDNVKIQAWHFIKDDLTLYFTHFENGKKISKLKPGLKLSVNNDELQMCNRGLHASLNALDALNYRSTFKICRVELSGKILIVSDKLCASNRKILWIADLTTVFPQFSNWLENEHKKELCRVTKRKEPWKLKKFNFLEEVFSGKEKISLTQKQIDAYYKYHLWGICELNYYTLVRGLLSKSEKRSNKIFNHLENFERYEEFYKVNSEFERLIYNAPRVK